MSGEIVTGRTGQIVVPELAEIRLQMEQENHRFGIADNVLGHTEVRLEEQLQTVRKQRNIHFDNHRVKVSELRSALTETAVRLVLDEGDVIERFTDDCYKIYADWAFESEVDAYSAFRVLTKAREIAINSKPGSLMALLSERSHSKVWKPSVPLIGVDTGFTNNPTIAIENPVVRFGGDWDDNVSTEKKDFSELGLDEINDTVLIESEEDLRENPFSIQKIHSLIDGFGVENSLPQIERIIIARNALGLTTNSEELYSEIVENFRKYNDIG